MWHESANYHQLGMVLRTERHDERTDVCRAVSRHERGRVRPETTTEAAPGPEMEGIGSAVSAGTYMFAAATPPIDRTLNQAKRVIDLGRNR
jgi:hypothetical protein